MQTSFSQNQLRRPITSSIPPIALPSRRQGPLQTESTPTTRLNGATIDISSASTPDTSRDAHVPQPTTDTQWPDMLSIVSHVAIPPRPNASQRVLSPQQPLTPTLPMLSVSRSVQQAMTSGINYAHIQREHLGRSLAAFPKARGETDPLLSQTVSLRTLSKKRAHYVRTTAFVTFLLLLAGLSFLAAMLALMIYVPYPVIKIAAAIVILLTASHLVHVQVKRLAHLRQHIFLTSIHLRRDRRSSSARQEAAETRHLTLIKEDTMTYLKALRSEQQGVRS